jgi:Tfp pilus assembly protein PilF
MLKRLLRGYPHWSNGHRILAEERLEHNDVAQAYSASRCYQALVATKPHERAHSNLLIAKCYLRRGDWQMALAALSQALKDSPQSPAILEELAAAHMLGGNYAEAKYSLEQIAHEKLSPQAKAALAFARTKA